MTETFAWSSPGTRLEVGGATHVMHAESDFEIDTVRASLAQTADADVVVDLLKNGQTIFTDDKLSVPAGRHTASMTTGFDPLVEMADLLSVEVLETGFVQTGSALTVTLRLKRLF